MAYGRCTILPVMMIILPWSKMVITLFINIRRMG
jgi:hypothetical protein